MTFLAALRLDRVEAPWLIDGPINGERFRLYVETVLLPTLRPNDIVVIDNLGSHRGKAIRRIIRSAGARLFFLPKYSPDLNPIEQLFAKLKHCLRKAARRSIDGVSDAIGQTLHTVTSDECRNYFINSGYEPVSTHPALGAVAAGGRAAVAPHHVMINPLGDEAACLVHRCFRMVNAVKRRAGLECRHIVRAEVAQVAVGSDDGTLAAAGDLTDILTHRRTGSLLRMIRN